MIQMSATIKNRILLVLGFLGIVVAGVLSLAETLQASVPCGYSRGCESVAADPWSHFFLGISNAYLGLATYLILTAFAASRIYVGLYQELRSIRLGLILSGAGLLVSLVLLYRMLFHIHAICPWCVTSDVIMILTFYFYIRLNQDLNALPSLAEAQKEKPEIELAPRAKYFVPTLAVATLVLLSSAGSLLRARVKTMDNLTNDDFKAVLDMAYTKNPNGKLTLIEFGDVVCPTCRELYPQVEQVVNQSGGKIKFVFAHFPLIKISEHHDAYPGAMLAEMAGEKGKFFDFLDAVYAPTADRNVLITLSQMKGIAATLGVDITKADRRLETASNASDSHPDTDPAFTNVLNELNLGLKLGVLGTPTYFLLLPNQKPVEADSQSIMDTLRDPKYSQFEGG